MTRNPVAPIRRPFRSILALALVAGAGIVSAAAVASGASFPSLRVWAFPGAYQDSSLVVPSRCVGSFQGPLPDSIREAARVVSVRFLRDRVAEKRPEFGGYRIYRMTNQLDSTKAVLVR